MPLFDCTCNLLWWLCSLETKVLRRKIELSEFFFLFNTLYLFLWTFLESYMKGIVYAIHFFSQSRHTDVTLCHIPRCSILDNFHPLFLHNEFAMWHFRLEWPLGRCRITDPHLKSPNKGKISHVMSPLG